MRDKAATSEAGFSLVELMMAMIVTFIVTGAIYGLLSGGQSAFRVQPERTERQQNIRNAMDAIMRDIATAGVGLPDLAQIFTQALDGTGPLGPNGPTDVLEMVTNPDNFPNQLVCSVSTSTNLILADQTIPSWAPVPPQTRPVLLITSDVPPRWGAARVTSIINTGAPGGNCDPTRNNQRPLVNLAAGCAGSGFGNALDPCNVAGVSLGEIVRYQIVIGADGVPSLHRVRLLLDATSPLRDVVIARGIEDLQVEYMQANTGCTAATPCANAPAVSLTLPPPNPNTDYNTIVTQVQVTLSARSNVSGLQGERRDATGRAYLRGSLTSTGSPRAALYAVNKQQPLPPATPPLWQ